jgi:hypothetical protein
VDHSRFLLIEEAKPGILIQDPQVTSSEDGTLNVSWRTNIPAESTKVTYGKDWPNRGANEKILPSGQKKYDVKIPPGQKASSLRASLWTPMG